MTRQSTHPFQYGALVGFEDGEVVVIQSSGGFYRIVVHKLPPEKPLAERSLSDRPHTELCGGNHCVPYLAVVCDRSFAELEKPFPIPDAIREWAKSAAELVDQASKVREGEWLFAPPA